jgi:hypothetical protein
MNNAILIIVECDNANITYQEVIPMVKKYCREYFGSKHFYEGPEYSPICYTNEVITQEDINSILDLIDNSSIRLYGLNNYVENNLKSELNIFTFPTNNEED